MTNIWEDNNTFANLAIAAIPGSEDLAKAIDEHIRTHRKDNRSYLVDLELLRSANGEARCRINQSLRGTDLYIVADVTNYSVTYRMNNFENHMSPDDHFRNLKRVISATCDEPERISVIMPFLYESRQHRRTGRESLDAASAIEELGKMGVRSLITFDAHDPRVSNSSPLIAFENFMPTYQFFKVMLNKIPDFPLTKEKLIVISPDEGAMERAIDLANVLGVNVGTFYKRRDYSQVINGKNPIVAHEFLGSDLTGKTVIVVDDMISSGDSMIDTGRHLKQLGAEKVVVCSTFGLFNNGLERFDQAYENGVIDYVTTTNLTYRDSELLTRPWYLEADLYKFTGTIVNYFNHDQAIPDTLSHVEKIQNFIKKYIADGYQYYDSLI